MNEWLMALSVMFNAIVVILAGAILLRTQAAKKEAEKAARLKARARKIDLQPKPRSFVATYVANWIEGNPDDGEKSIQIFGTQYFQSIEFTRELLEQIRNAIRCELVARASQAGAKLRGDVSFCGIMEFDK